MELQFHTEKSFAVKQSSHELYEAARNVSTCRTDQDDLNKKMRFLNSTIPIPSDVHSFHAEKRFVHLPDKAIVHTERDESKHMECFLVSFHGKSLISGLEYFAEEGQIISARSDLQENHTIIYICNEHEHVSVITKDHPIVFNKENAQKIVDEIMHSEIRNVLSR